MSDPTVLYLRQLADGAAQVPRATLVAAVEDVKAVADAVGPAFTRARPGALYDLTSFDQPIEDRGAGGLFARVQGVPVGFWSMLTYGTTRHLIPLARSGVHSKARRSARGARLLTFQGGEGAAYGPVIHRGARGRGSWDRVLTIATPKVFDRFEKAVDAAVAGHG